MTLIQMAVMAILSVDVPLRNYSLTHSLTKYTFFGHISQH